MLIRPYCRCEGILVCGRQHAFCHQCCCILQTARQRREISIYPHRDATRVLSWRGTHCTTRRRLRSYRQPKLGLATKQRRCGCVFSTIGVGYISGGKRRSSGLQRNLHLICASHQESRMRDLFSHYRPNRQGMLPTTQQSEPTSTCTRPDFRQESLVHVS